MLGWVEHLQMQEQTMLAAAGGGFSRNLTPLAWIAEMQGRTIWSDMLSQAQRSGAEIKFKTDEDLREVEIWAEIMDMDPVADRDEILEWMALEGFDTGNYQWARTGEHDGSVPDPD